jgi:hypothetical protein
MSIDVAALDDVRAKLEQLHQRCLQGVVRVDELRSDLKKLDIQARKAFLRDCDPYRHYDRTLREHQHYSPKETPSGYVGAGDSEHVVCMLDAVREALKRVTPGALHDDFAEQAEFYLPEGDRFHARQTLYHLLKRATASIDIVDVYLDNEVFEFLAMIEGTVALRLVTGPPKSLFISQLQAFRAGRSVEVRSIANATVGAHDRFIILDGRQAWHLGMSINGLGKRASMINRIDNPTEKARMLSDVAAWWQSGTVL